MDFPLLVFQDLYLYLLQSPFNQQSHILPPFITSLTQWHNHNHSRHISNNHHHIHIIRVALQADPGRDHPSILPIPRRINNNIINLMTGSCHHIRHSTA